MAARFFVVLLPDTMRIPQKWKRRPARFNGEDGVFRMGVGQQATRHEEPQMLHASRPTPRPRRCGGPEHHGVSAHPYMERLSLMY